MSDQEITRRYDKTTSHSTNAPENTAQVAGYVEITAKDLPLTCPMPTSSLWNAHPRVRLALDDHGEAHCPYCGTSYKFTGESPHAH